MTDGRLQAVVPSPLDCEGNPGVCIRKEDNVGVVDLDELQEIGEDNLFWALKPLFAIVENLDAKISFGLLGSPIPPCPSLLNRASLGNIAGYEETVAPFEKVTEICLSGTEAGRDDWYGA
jgi:hypothetical protein